MYIVRSRFEAPWAGEVRPARFPGAEASVYRSGALEMRRSAICFVWTRAASWSIVPSSELLVDLRHRGLATGPELAIGDGKLGFWKALRQRRSVERDALKELEAAKTNSALKMAAAQLMRARRQILQLTGQAAAGA